MILKCIDTGIRSYQEGERVFNAKHVIYCGIRADYLKEKQFLALCLKSSALSDMPHEVNVKIINENNNFES